MNSDDTDVARIAVLARSEPDVLIQGALDHIAALLIQHDALRNLSIDALKDAVSCPCKDCHKAAAQILANLAVIEHDAQRLETAGDLIGDITAYIHPEAKAIDKAVKARHHHIQVNRLEDALKASGEDL
jgi:hypothetical protein